MRIRKRAAQILLMIFITSMVLEACGTAKGKACKPPRKRYYHNTFINM